MTIAVNEAPIKQFFLDPEKTKLSPVAIMFLNQLARVAQGKDWSAVKAADSLLFNGHADTYFGTAAKEAAYALVTGSNFTTTSTSLVDITGLSLALEANSTYEIFVHMAENPSTNAGLAIGMNFSAAGATIRALATTFIPESRTAAPYSDRITVFNTATAAMLLSSAYTGETRITGIVRTGANAGN